MKKDDDDEEDEEEEEDDNNDKEEDCAATAAAACQLCRYCLCSSTGSSHSGLRQGAVAAECHC